VVIGNPEGKRVALFQEALARAGLPPAAVVAWADLLAGRDTPERVVRPGTVVRIESPGQHFEVEKAILAAGADVPDSGSPERIGRSAALRLPFDKGRILYPRQWYLGFGATLRRLERQLARCPDHVVMNRPADIALMFDKRRCHELFARGGVPVPCPLGPVGSYAQLRQRMGETGLRRVFVKLAHGSSASGVVAYETNGPHEQAFTTVELVRQDGGLRLYNSRKIRRYRRPGDVAALVDALAREGVQVEEWVPKASFGGRAFDLRLVVIAGRARHVVVRCSASPMTNLHLKNQRGDPAALRSFLGPTVWQSVTRSAERAAALFPGCLYAGLDVAVARGGRRHAVLEVNAFGDLLPGVLCEGLDTYAAEVEALDSFSGEPEATARSGRLRLLAKPGPTK
jgi:hypothetical protein